MEKIPAACAMEWSIHLEKGLRSKKPSHRMDAIKQIGGKLQQWSMEPCISITISDIYGMVPGEDSLFANTILLRLADAFCNGDIEAKKCVLRVFLVELQHITKKGKMYNGILAKERVPNYVELLKRLKAAYEAGDLEVKLVALRLFGCWASFAKDSLHICFLILTCMQSNHDLEVKASLFAAGCFCRLSEDFSCVVLKVLIDIISSIERSLDVRLAAVRALAKLQCSPAITNKAYQAGRRVFMDLPMNCVKAEMLLSLSKLASLTSMLFYDQFDLLQSFLSHEYSSPLKARALRCLYILLGASYHFHVAKNVLSALFSIFNDDKAPLDLQYLSLQILQKIFFNKLLDLVILDMPDLFKMVEVIKNMDNLKRKRGLFLSLLVDILCSMKMVQKEHCASTNWLSITAPLQSSSPSLISCEHDLELLFNNVSFFIMDQVIMLVDEIICSYNESKCVENPTSVNESFALKKELKGLLNLILCLAREDPSSSLIALSRIGNIVHSLVRLLNEHGAEICMASEAVLPKEIHSEKSNLVFKPLKSNGGQNTVISVLILYFCRFANAYFILLYETNSITSEVHHILKDVVNCIKQYGYSFYDSFEVLRLMMHLLSLCYFYNKVEGHTFKDDEVCCHYSVCWLRQESLSLDFSKKMIKNGSFWQVYRAGKFSCLRGLWFAATFSFRKLMDAVKPGYYINWIKALMLYAGGESEIRLLLFPKVCLELINGFTFASESDRTTSNSGAEIDECVGEGYNWSAFIGNLSRICSRIRSSENALEASADSSTFFLFQRWFLNLRGKFLEIVEEIFKLVSSNSLSDGKLKENIGLYSVNATNIIQDMHTLVCALAKLSTLFNKVAKGYDLLATSFMDIDAASLRGISMLGVICSTFAFCASFASNALSAPAFRNVMSFSVNNLEFYSNLMIVRDLAERLWDIDNTIARKLMQIISIEDDIEHGLSSITNVHGYGLLDGVSLSLIQSVINDILCFQGDLRMAKDVDDLIAVFLRGLLHLCCFIKKWMEIPSVTPKYFFRVRPCIGSELFIFQANSEHRNELFIKPGFQLPLNLCIQLKNTSGIKLASVAKIYCVLAVRPSDRFAIESGRRQAATQCAVQTLKFEDMVSLSETLQHFIKASNGTDKEDKNGVDFDGLLTTFVCFEPNKLGLGFSTCLLNVSQFEEGSYPIKWLSCCVDDGGFYWNLIPLNIGSVFTVKKS